MAFVEPASALAVERGQFRPCGRQNGRMYVYSPVVILQRAFMLPNLRAPAGVIGIDVIPDGCTLVYDGDGASSKPPQ
ncbi:MAG TPA: hypothetical protein VF713_05685 [Thermoanaerobaculia bacterium]